MSLLNRLLPRLPDTQTQTRQAGSVLDRFMGMIPGILGGARPIQPPTIQPVYGAIAMGGPVFQMLMPLISNLLAQLNGNSPIRPLPMQPVYGAVIDRNPPIQAVYGAMQPPPSIAQPVYGAIIGSDK